MLTIRHTTPADLAPAMEIMVAAWTPIFDGFRTQLGDEIYSAQFDPWVELKSSRISRALMSDYGYVAELDGRIVGFAHWAIREGTPVAAISENAVASDLRGQGIGGKLHAFLLERMREAGFRYVTVQTGLDEAHAPARRAYEKAGFSVGLPSIEYYMPLRDARIGPCPLVRPAREADIEAACAIGLTAWGRIHEVYADQYLGRDLHAGVMGGWEARKCANVAAAMGSERGFVAEVDGKVAGFISYQVDAGRKVGIIGENAVDPAFRGRGIAGQLYSCVLSGMAAEGCQFARVHTGLDEGHAPARRAYEKAGFAKSLSHIAYYRPI